MAHPAIHTVPPLPFTVIEVEALAARQALEFAMEIGVDWVILEGDSEFFINALESGCSFLAQFGHIANDVQYLASFFPALSVSHVRRHCNSHSLERRVVFSPYLLVWMEDHAPRN